MGKARVFRHGWPHGLPVGTVPSGGTLTSLSRAGPVVVAPVDPTVVVMGVLGAGLRERVLQKELAEVGVLGTLASLQPTRPAAKLVTESLAKAKAVARTTAGRVLPPCAQTFVLSRRNMVPIVTWYRLYKSTWTRPLLRPRALKMPSSWRTLQPSTHYSQVLQATHEGCQECGLHGAKDR